jgi:hypothetical protein
MFSLFLCLYDVHCICYISVCMSSVQYVVRVSRIIIVTSYCLYMFFISRMERSACLSYVSQRPVQAFHLVYATFSVFICLCRGFYRVLYCISCSECYFYFCISKKVCNFPSFLIFLKFLSKFSNPPSPRGKVLSVPILQYISCTQLFVYEVYPRWWTISYVILDLISHQTLMMEMEIVPEMSVIFNQLTWLIADEDFINLG